MKIILDLPPTQDAKSQQQDYEPFLVGNLYKPSLANITGWGVDPNYIIINNS